MIFDQYSKYDGLGLAELVRKKEVSPQELADSAIDAIERLNPDINCVPQILPDVAKNTIKAGGDRHFY